MQEERYRQHPSPCRKCTDVYTKCAIVHNERIPFPLFAISNMYSTNDRTWLTNRLGAYHLNKAKGGNEIPAVTENL